MRMSGPLLAALSIALVTGPVRATADTATTPTVPGPHPANTTAAENDPHATGATATGDDPHAARATATDNDPHATRATATDNDPHAARTTGAGRHAARATSTGAGRRRARVLLLALDGLDPGLVRRWTADGSMPNLARLIDGGLMTQIDCVVGMSSPVVWTTVATGVPPTEHGITGFRIGEDPVNSSHRRRPAFWSILAAQGIDLATVGWMVTWPAEENAGVVVSDRAWLGRRAHDVQPPGVVDPLHHVPHMRRDEILARFTRYPFDPAWESLPKDDPRYAVHYLLHRRLLNIFRRDTIYAGVARHLARKRDLDVLALYLQGTDYVGHGFWQWFEPAPFRKRGWKIPEKDVRALGSVVPSYYRYVDELVGTVLPLVDENALVLLLSDHGFQPSTAFRNDKDHSLESRFLSGTHRKQATLILSGPQVRRGAQPAGRVTHFDILPTLLFALDLPRARDQRGRPLTELFDAGFVRARDDRLVDTYATRADAAARPPARNDLDAEIVEELRSLGYIR